MFGRWKEAEAAIPTAAGRHWLLDGQSARASAVASRTSPRNPAFSGKRLRPSAATAYAHLPRICRDPSRVLSLEAKQGCGDGT